MSFQSAVCTLFENDYHYGVGALTNSLYRYGFRGVIWVGYRGTLPPWATQLTKAASYDEFTVTEGCSIRFVPLNTTIHLTNYKPDFMLHLWEKHCPEAQALFYFDPDIVIKCRWSFYEEWVRYGVALCQDVTNGNMPDNHPLRLNWKEYAKGHGHVLQREVNQYFNAGFIGLAKEQISFLETWKNLLKSLEEEGANLTDFMSGDRSQPFYVPDQDMLNLAAMITPCHLSTIGPEGMDLVPGGFTMSHAIGSPKPWRKRFILDALSGKRTSLAIREHWKNTRLPIRLYPAFQQYKKEASIYCSAAISRFIG